MPDEEKAGEGVTPEEKPKPEEQKTAEGPKTLAEANALIATMNQNIETLTGKASEASDLRTQVTTLTQAEATRKQEELATQGEFEKLATTLQEENAALKGNNTAISRKQDVMDHILGLKDFAGNTQSLLTVATMLDAKGEFKEEVEAVVTAAIELVGTYSAEDAEKEKTQAFGAKGSPGASKIRKGDRAELVRLGSELRLKPNDNRLKREYAQLRKKLNDEGTLVPSDVATQIAAS